MKLEFLFRAARRFVTTDYGTLFRNFGEVADIAVSHYYGNERKHPFRKFHFILDIIFCYFAYGADYDDYRDYRFYIKKGRERKRYMTAFRKRKVMYRFENETGYENIENKHLFNRKYAEFIKRDWISSETSGKDEIMQFLNMHKRIIAKPTDSGKGVGIVIIDSTDTEGVRKLLDDIDRGIVFVMEEVIENREEIKALNPSSLNTIRAVTAIDRKGEIHILGISMRMGSGGSIIDNLSSGGIMCNINPDYGIIDSWGITKSETKYIKHPDTGVFFPGFRIPDWDKVLAFLHDVASFDKEVRYVGWDLAITPDGVELIEGNCRPGGDTTQYFSQNGIIPELMSYL